MFRLNFEDFRYDPLSTAQLHVTFAHIIFVIHAAKRISEILRLKQKCMANSIRIMN